MSCSEDNDSPPETNKKSFRHLHILAMRLKPSDCLDEAYHQLEVRFTDFTKPTNETEWKQLYEDVLSKSKNHAVPYHEHLWTWVNLLKLAIQWKMGTETILTSYVNAFTTLPIKFYDPDATWVHLINAVYAHIIQGTISEKEAYDPLRAAMDKFKYSPVHAKVYWDTIFRNEKRLMKKSEISSDEQHMKLVVFLKERFSYPYFGMEEDYNEFTSWSVNVNLDKEYRLEVQKIFMENVKSRDMEYINKIMEGKPDDDLYQKPREVVQSNHHFVFEEWVDAICQDKYPNYDQVGIICEEMIASEPESVCYYWVYLRALVSPNFNHLKRDDMIRNLIQRCWQLGKTSCPGLDRTFLEYSLALSCKCLTLDISLDLIEKALSNEEFLITKNIDKWYARSRGVIIAVSNLIQDGYIDHSAFEKYFERVIFPCTMDFFKLSDVPEELNGLSGYETKFLDLLQLWLACQKSYYLTSWDQFVDTLTNIFMNNCNPVMLVGYVDMVKNVGKPQQALEASLFALDQMEMLDKAWFSKLSSRRCYVKLLRDHLSILSTSGNVMGQYEFTKTVIQKLNSLISENGLSDFNDFISPRPMIREFCPYESIGKPSGIQKKDDSFASPEANQADNSIVKKLMSLKMTYDNEPTETKVEEQIDQTELSKIFVSNLHFKATEDDLMNAFKEKGFYPVSVEIKRNDKGGSRGMAYVAFSNKESADLAVQLCDKFFVQGRVTFVSPYKPGKKASANKSSSVARPTVLNITNLPAEWQDENKVFHKLSVYGHIRDARLEESRGGTFIAKVEFHMTEDARNAYEQIIENKIFGEDSTCRLGYASTKRQIQESVMDKESKKSKKRLKTMPEKGKKETAHESGSKESQQESPDGEVNYKPQEIGPQMPPGMGQEKPKPKTKPAKSFNLVPTQAVRQNLPRVAKRNHMKERLGLISSGSSSPSESPEKKLMKLTAKRKQVPGLHTSTSSQSLDTSSESESISPDQKRMMSDKDVKMQLTADVDNAASFSSNGEGERMEEDRGEKPTRSRRPLSNKDFQNMFKK